MPQGMNIGKAELTPIQDTRPLSTIINECGTCSTIVLSKLESIHRLLLADTTQGCSLRCDEKSCVTEPSAKEKLQIINVNLQAIDTWCDAILKELYGYEQ